MDKIVKIGRRKTAVARVFVKAAAKAGNGTITVNDRAFENYFPIDIQRMKVLEPFSVLEISAADFDIQVNLDGGGTTGQAEALRLGIARSLITLNPEHRPALKRQGLLTRDSRMVERKKYGRPKARKRFQFSKR
jgi:small subunit ribosomal protein S9